MRKQQHLLAALALAAFGLVVAPAKAASEAPAGTAAGKPVKQAVKKRVKKAGTAPAKRTGPSASRKKAAPRLAAKPPAGAGALAGASPSADVHTPITRPGDYRFSIRHQGGTRTYRVHVPAGLGDDPAPLVVALHGATVDQPANEGLYGLGRAADRHGFVAVFPDAAKPAGAGSGGWNATGAPGGADDVGFIDTVVANVFRQLNIARLQIYAAGMSDGGSMAYRLACERPHLFRAVASVGGADTTLKCAPDKAVSVLHVHARNDSRVLLASLPGSGAGALPGAVTAADSAARWARLNGCMEAPRPVLEKAGASCQAWSYCREQAQVQLCVTDTGGHSWPGALKTRDGEVPSQALSATETIWAFFSSR